jgi:hypothetical protein
LAGTGMPPAPWFRALFFGKSVLLAAVSLTQQQRNTDDYKAAFQGGQTAVSVRARTNPGDRQRLTFQVRM